MVSDRLRLDEIYNAHLAPRTLSLIVKNRAAQAKLDRSYFYQTSGSSYAFAHLEYLPA